MCKPLLLILPLLALASCSTTHMPKLPKPPEYKVLATQHGMASWYSVKTNRGTKTASGRRLHDNGRTAAHKYWPLGSKVRVTCLFNGESRILTITDRGPYVKGRVIDVTIGAAKRMGFYSRGITKVKIELLERGKWQYQH
ncbi:MAG: septal ring lytic transglycosylase RlpA family protein [Akkermansiaceae bacterium]|nr:septal ring lytic transglycosylase RlpA family protein [Akkermansiaceae bacterium]